MSNGNAGAPPVLSIAVRGDGVAVLTYDVAGAAVNTLQASFATELERVLAEVVENPEIKAAILVSGKPGSWIAGADLEVLAAVQTAAEAEAFCRTGHAAGAKIAASPKPIVAAIHGAALGGGFELALACQGRVLSDDRKTVLGLPEVQLGLLPGMNGLQRLALAAGLQIALEYGLSGKNLRPAKAKQLGLANDIVPVTSLIEVAAKLALRLAESAAANAEGGRKTRTKKLIEALSALVLEGNPIGRGLLFRKARQEVMAETGGHYPAPLRILDVLETLAKKGFEASREVEAKAFGELVVSTTAHRLIEIFFATNALKKDPGVDVTSIEPRQVERLAVLGATTGDSAVQRADLVIEAVFEDLALKQQVLAEVEERGRAGVIFASSTSSIPIAQIAARARHPENVIGMHYFSPVQKMPLLEVIQTAQTAPEVVATAVALGKKQGKTVIVVNDGAGFYTTRILGPYLHEAAWLLLEGASIEAIDQALVTWGFPVGPLTLLDEVGLDVAAHVGLILREAFGDRIEAPAAVATLAAGGRLGRKNEKGFYLYGEAAAKAARGRGKKGNAVDESVYEALGLALPGGGKSGAGVAWSRRKIAIEEIQMRCSLQLVNEALHCFGEGILRSARDGDIGAVLGLGFPPFRGGPFRYVDSLGAREALKRVEAYHGRFGKRWAPAPLLIEMARENKRFHDG